MNDTALKTDLKIIPEKGESYNSSLHARLVLWKDQKGHSLKQIARKLARSETALSQYLNFKYRGDITGIERDITDLLRREDLEFTTGPEIFCKTSSSYIAWELFQVCYEELMLGILIAHSGSGKTKVAVKWQQEHRNTVLITADITKRSLGNILRELAYKLDATPYEATNTRLLESIVDHLKSFRRFIIIDESQFLKWEHFEVIRTIRDQVRVGVVYLATPRLYVEMKKRRQYLWDQILSRIPIQRRIDVIERRDVKLIADSIYPGLPKNCLEFLYQKALEPGRFRVMTALLNRSVHIHNIEKTPVNLNLLKEVEKFTTI